MDTLSLLALSQVNPGAAAILSSPAPYPLPGQYNQRQRAHGRPGRSKQWPSRYIGGTCAKPGVVHQVPVADGRATQLQPQGAGKGRLAPGAAGALLSIVKEQAHSPGPVGPCAGHNRDYQPSNCWLFRVLWVGQDRAQEECLKGRFECVCRTCTLGPLVDNQLKSLIFIFSP